MIGVVLLVLVWAVVIVGLAAWANVRDRRALMRVPPPPSNVRLVPKDAP